MPSKILIVEDEAITAMDIKNILENTGYKVISIVYTGEEAIEKAEKLKPDLILIDIFLKGEIDGIEAASKIMNSFDIPVIYLTAYSDKNTFERAKLTEPYGFITKPIDHNELKATIEIALYKHKLDKKLKEKEEKYHLLYQDAPLPYQSLNESGHITEVNQAWLDTLGYTKDEVIGKWFGDFLKPNSTKKFMEKFPQFKAEGEICNIELEMKRKDGSTLFTEFNGKIKRDANGNFQRTQCIFQDITKQIKAEKKLNESKERYKLFFNNPLMGFALCKILTDDKNNPVDFVYLKINQAFEKLTGLKKEEVLNKKVTDVLDPKEVAEIIQIYGKVALTGESTAFEYPIPSLDKYYEISAFSPENQQFIVFFTDITERKKAEKTIKESEKRYRRIVETTTEGIWEMDNEYITINVNPAMANMLGYSVEEMIGKPIPHFLFKEDLMEHAKRMGERKGGMIGKYETKLKHKDGSTVWTLVSATPKKDINNNFSGSFAMFIDITERKKAEDHFQKEVERESFLLELYKKAPQLTDEELYNCALDLTVSLTDSTIGFFHKISDDQKNIIITAWNNEAQDTCKASFKNHYPIEESGNWTDCIQAKRPLVYNDYENSPNRKGFPKGHTPVKRFISTPVFDEDKIKFIFGVGNKIEEYDDHDVIQIQSVANELYRIIKQRHSAQALKEAHENLEKQVEKRTVELKEAYQYLKESEEKFRLIFNEADDSIVLNEMMKNGSPGKIIEANEATTKRLGYTKEELLNMTPKDVIAPECQGKMPKNVEKLKEDGHVLFEIIHIAKDGRRIPVEVDNHLIEFKGKKTALTIVRDITERKKMEKRLKETIFELERSNKELEQFAYVSSHDLQEPLRTIASFTQLLERRYKGKFDSDADEFMDFIVEAAIRMKDQIQGLLEYSRVARGEKFEPLNINEILNQTVDNLKVLIEESNAEIIVDELPNVIGDANQLGRVFQNLISNAIKFRKHEEPLKIHISANKDVYNNEYVFSVADNGIGIEEQYTERIFTIFQRLHTREKYKGTGIGLSIVKRIIERHGGRIWVESSFGVGSTFYFTIPINKKEN